MSHQCQSSLSHAHDAVTNHMCYKDIHIATSVLTGAFCLRVVRKAGMMRPVSMLIEMSLQCKADNLVICSEAVRQPHRRGGG